MEVLGVTGDRHETGEEWDTPSGSEPSVDSNRESST